MLVVEEAVRISKEVDVVVAWVLDACVVEHVWPVALLRPLADPQARRPVDAGKSEDV
jgi:hypothetical protein